MEIIEILLPVGYKPGNKVTDKILVNLKSIYIDVVLTYKPTGRYSKLIILNSFIPHDKSVLDIYPPNDTWYFMYDMNWGRQWYEENKPLQLITDKEYPGSRFTIPTGMIELSKIKTKDCGIKLGKLCVMESYKEERFKQYDKYLQSDCLDIDVIGTTMNNSYEHTGNKVNSVPYNELPNLLSQYSYCLILWDEFHNINNLPLKVAECLDNGVVPILDSQYGASMFPTVDNVLGLNKLLETLKYHESSIIHKLINYYKNNISLIQIRRQSQLIETDALFLKELENLLVWGRNKHRGHYWRDNLDTKDFIEALKRHLKAYESGETIDPETGISHLIAIAANAMFKRRIDEQE